MTNPILEAQIREQAEREGKSVETLISRPLWPGLQSVAERKGESPAPDENDVEIRDPAYYAAAYAPGEVVRIGEEIYRDQIKPHVEKEENIGRILLIDITTGNYEFQENKMPFDCSNRLRRLNPKAVLFAVRVGSPTAYKRGGHRRIR